MGTSGGLYFPIKLRCADPAGVLGNEDLGDALTRALRRSFARAKASLSQEVALGDGVWLHPPTLNDDTLTPEEEARLLEIVSRAIDQAARIESLPRIKLPAIFDMTEDQELVTSGGETRGEISEQFDPDRFEPVTANYEIPSYDRGKKQVPLRPKVDLLEDLLLSYDAAIIETDKLLELTGKLDRPNDTRIEAVGIIRSLRGDLWIERDNLATVVQIYLGNTDESTISDSKLQILHRYFIFFFTRQLPDPVKIEKRKKQLQLGLVLSSMIRANVAELDARVAKLTKPEESYLREITMDVGSYYLEAAGLGQHFGQMRILFLENFYADPQTLAFYAVARFAREELPILWRNLKTSTNYALGDIENTNLLSSPISRRPFDEAQFFAVDRALILQALLFNQSGGPIKDLPRDIGSVGTAPDPKLTAVIGANILQLEIEVPVLNLWRVVEQLVDAIGGELYVGTSLVHGDRDRKAWLKELQDLRNAFAAELSTREHKDFGTRGKDWEASVKRLHKNVYDELRSIQIRRKIGEMIPLLIVSTVVAGGIGVWVAEITDGSVWLVALSEGATLTLINAAFGPPGSRPTTITGWATQLGTNTLLAGIGQVFKAIAPGAEFLQGLSPMRRTLLITSLRVGAIGSTTVLQTAIQALEAKSQGEGGESSFTDMLTMNLVVNGLGALFGAALHAEPRNVGGKALQLSTPEEIIEAGRAAGVKIEDLAAKNWLNLASRSQEFMTQTQEIERAAKSGKLSEAEFNRWKEKGKALAAELEQKLPALAEILGIDMSPQEIKAKLAELRVRIEKAQYSGPRLLLPEFTEGLKRVGDSQTFVYDPANVSKERLRMLKEFHEKNGTVTDLPGGGWEVRDSNGKILFQIIELPATTIKALLPSLESLAQSSAAQRGLVRTSEAGLVTDVGESGPTLKSVPQLRSQLTQAAVSSPREVARLLEILGRSDKPPSIDALRGMSNYLDLNGDPKILARALTFRDYRARAAESANHIERVLTSMASWDRSAVNGFELLLNRVRPWTATSSDSRGSLEDLFANFEPDQVKGIVQSIDVLTPRSRGLAGVVATLMSQGIVNQRGAMGELTAGVLAAEHFPGKLIIFQEPSVTPEGFRRIHDILVVDPATATTPEIRLFSIEVKEVSTSQLGSRAPHELAVDIRLDHEQRQRQAAAGQTPRPRFDSFRWQIRDLEIKQIAIEELQRQGKSNPGAGDIELMKLDIVRSRLRRAFQDPALNTMDPAEVLAYQKEFEIRLGFVQFF